MLPEAITLRGEMVSLFVVAAVLLLAVRPVATLTRLDRSLVGDLFWTAGVAFVVLGHAAYLAIASPASLLDPFVLLRVQSGLEPLAGAAAIGAVWWWYARRQAVERRASMALALAAGVALATITYDGACVLRDACFGAPAPAPFGFPMSGLADARVATPLVEAAALLALLGVAVRAWHRFAAVTLAALIVSALALVRAAFTPLSAGGATAIDARAALTLALGALALALAAWRASRTRRDHARTHTQKPAR